MLLLQTGIVGVFASMDLFLFYVFFELTLVPMYFIVGVWGGERRIYAAVKFFLYTALGSLLMLVGILYLYWQAWQVNGFASFHFWTSWGPRSPSRSSSGSSPPSRWRSPSRCPVFPLHTWLPDAHVEAPTPGSVVLAAVLLKMGTYGFLRFVLPFFPEASAHPTVVIVMLTLGVIGIIYAAWWRRCSPTRRSSWPTPRWPTWAS
jgi:NADH-quinone oxidoreductase subunit M